MSFFLELRRRNVVRVGIAYLAGSWLLLQVADLVLSNFEAPAWILRALMLACVFGFPIALLLAWFYELTPDGVKTSSEVGTVEPTKFLGRKLDFGIIAVLVIAVSFLAFDNYIREDSADSAVVSGRENSIAVLPFVNLSADPENEYFCDGMAEEILNLLARISGLKVVGRTSSFAFKGKNEDLRDIGAALGVATLLEGSVRKQGDVVRITAQLINASDGTHMWSQTYDRTVTDVFAVQDAVAASIIGALQIVVGENPKRGRPTEIAAAYTLFLKARALLNAYELREAERSALEALALDPDFAEAYELLANVYWAEAGGVLSPPVAQRLMAETAGKALAINPDLVLAKALQSADPAAYSVQAEIEAFEQAALAEPDNALVLGALVFDLRKSGYLGKALEVAERLLASDPLSASARGRWQSTLLAVGRTCEALTSISTFDEDAAFAGASDRWFEIEANLAAGRDDTAVALLESFFGERGFPDSGWASALVFGARNPVTGEVELDRQISQIIATVPETDRRGMQRTLSGLYLVFGFLDRYYEIISGFELSDAAWTDADDLVDKGVVYPALGFTAHPRYVEVAERLGIVDAWEERGPPDYCRQDAGSWVCESIEAGAPDECE